MIMQFRQQLKENKMMVGSWISTGSLIVAELMASAGFDFLTVDVEHSAVDLPQTQALFQAICAGNPNCARFVRLAGNSYRETKRFLDAGATGVIAPLINSSEEAAELVRSVKYPPVGQRGVGFCRANTYGMDFDKYTDASNEQACICVQIEHIDAVNNIDQILSVEGIDAVMIGPYDLSASMGITAQFDHPKMVAATAKILASCKKNGVIPGIHVVQPNPDEVMYRYGEGYRFIAYSLDITMLSKACTDGLKTIKGNFAGENK